MANFKRNKPRSQPRSAMDSYDRVFKEPRGLPSDEEVSEPKRKPKRKPYGIEARYTGSFSFLSKEWKPYKRYVTEKARDTALILLKGKLRHGFPSRFEYRAAE